MAVPAMVVEGNFAPMLVVKWQGGWAFESNPPGGPCFVMDASIESGGQSLGPSPVEALLSAAAACSAMDVIGILRKMRQDVTEYWVDVAWERAPEGTLPRPITSITLRHNVRGNAIDPSAVDRAVELSDSKYCTVVSTLRAAPKVTSTYRID